MDCNQTSNCGCPSDCPIQLDLKCLFYHQYNQQVTELDGLSLPNGTNLELIIEVIDEKIKALNLTNISLPYLRQNYIINTLSQISIAIDSELQDIRTTISNIDGSGNVTLVANSSNSIEFQTSGLLDHILTGNVKISETINNSLTINADGLYNNPQTLSIDYNNKTISILNGNTINLSSLLNLPSGYLGEVINDPTSSINGNYWYNTTQNKLKVKVNNIIKEILTA